MQQIYFEVTYLFFIVHVVHDAYSLGHFNCVMINEFHNLSVTAYFKLS